MLSKRLTVLVTLILTLTLLLFPSSIMAAPTVHLDGKQLSFDVPPIIENGRTLVPLRAIFEAMGATVTWDEASYSAKAVKGSTVVVIKIGSKAPTINGKVTELDVPAKIVNGRTLAPLRFVGEAFGGQVIWDAVTQNINIFSAPNSGQGSQNQNIIFLHHSTGACIWDAGVEQWFSNYNSQNGTRYNITQTNFPKESPYGWNNYPYDYYNIWVRNAGYQSYKEEPTLEMLTQKYNVIVFKHCFPVSGINADRGTPDVNSGEKTLENYKLQYQALKKKMNQFPDTKFILWTPPALVAKATTSEEARRANEFSEWVKNVWDTPNDNIFLWDFRSLESENGLYCKDSYAWSESDSHPNSAFSKTVAPYFCKRIVDVVQGNGDRTNLTGK